MKKPFYENSKAYLICGLVGVVGAAYIAASVFLNSITTVIDVDEKMTDGMTLMDTVKYSLSTLKNGGVKLSGFFSAIFPLLLLVLLFASLLLIGFFAVKDNFQNPNYIRLQKAEEESKSASAKGSKDDKEDGKEKSEGKDSEGGDKDEDKDSKKKAADKSKQKALKINEDNRIYKFVTNHRYITRIIPLVVSMLSLFGLYHTSAYKNVYKNTVSLVDSWKSIIIQYQAAGIQTSMSADIHIGIAKILMIVGIVFCIAAFCFNFILDTLNEEQ